MFVCLLFKAAQKLKSAVIRMRPFIGTEERVGDLELAFDWRPR
jgi:hypothetical protein